MVAEIPNCFNLLLENLQPEDLRQTFGKLHIYGFLFPCSFCTFGNKL